MISPIDCSEEPAWQWTSPSNSENFYGKPSLFSFEIRCTILSIISFMAFWQLSDIMGSATSCLNSLLLWECFTEGNFAPAAPWSYDENSLATLEKMLCSDFWWSWGSARRIIFATISSMSSSLTSFHCPRMFWIFVPETVRISTLTGVSAQMVLVRRWGGRLSKSKYLRCVFPTPGWPSTMHTTMITSTKPSFNASSSSLSDCLSVQCHAKQFVFGWHYYQLQVLSVSV